MSSQRHKLWERGATSAGEIHAQGVVAPGIAMQVDPEAVGVLKPGPPLYNTGLELEEPPDPTGAITVPIGEPGGPLSGSSLTGAIPESIDPGPLPGVPTLTSISPNTGEAGGSDITCLITGTGFHNETVLVWNGADDNAAYNNENEMTTVVKLSLASIASTCTVQVRNGQEFSNTITFEITEPVTEPAEGERDPGPFNIVRIDNADEGMFFVMESGVFEVGDEVLVEATGNTSVNGNWTVLLVDDSAIVLDNGYELTTVIEAKGRITITGAA